MSFASFEPCFSSFASCFLFSAAAFDACLICFSHTLTVVAASVALRSAIDNCSLNDCVSPAVSAIPADNACNCLSASSTFA